MYSKVLSTDSPELEEIHSLYERSFPREEKMQWERLRNTISSQNILTAYYADNEHLTGFTYVFIVGDAAYLSYFAVEEKLRGKGYGSEILHMLGNALADKTIVIDIEEMNDKAGNAGQRRKRHDFYIHNGFMDSDVYYSIWYVDYELLSRNGTVTKTMWSEITHHVWGSFAERIRWKGDTNMKWAVLATWKMAYNGVKIASDVLSGGKSCAEAVLKGVSDVEDNPEFHSVGYGGRPDKTGHVVLDGGYMDGDTLHFGGVASIEGFRSPVHIAYSLIQGDANNLLVGKGAEEYAAAHGFERRNNLTENSKKIYEDKIAENQKLKAYDGHDTVCFLALDENKSMSAGTSTSGLFMKEPGRTGDTPLPGNGYYADSKVGAAAATGMGEEIMKGALSFAAVLYMKQGLTAQEAAEKAVNDLDHELTERNGYAQPMSLIVLDKEGNYGIGTNVEFTYVYASENTAPVIMEAVPVNGKLDIHPYHA